MRTPSLGAPPHSPNPPVPALAGDWWRIAAPPVLERYHREGVQTVDFTVFRATDGTWQLISCVRNTDCPGAGRLLYRWEGASLADRDWKPMGIFWLADPGLGQVAGRIQAPHCVRADGRYYLFYNSQGAHCLVSDDGKDFRHHRTREGDIRFFEMARDVMLFDNRARDGLWYAYFTDIVPGRYEERRNHTVAVRTAPSLDGPWSAVKHDLGVVSSPPDGYLFAFAESPFVLHRDGWYYRFEQLNVLASRSPLRWDVPILTTLGGDPMALLSPEIVEDAGRLCIAGYRNHGKDGIFLCRLDWTPSTPRRRDRG